MSERQDIGKLYQRAIACGRRNGLVEEAEDFAGWIATKWLEGLYQHSTLEQSLIDYRRKQHGDYRTGSGRLRKSERRYGISLTPDEGDEAGQAKARAAERAISDGDGVSEGEREFDLDPSLYVSGSRRKAYEIVMQDELTMHHAGVIMGISESRVSQILKSSRAEIERFVLLEEMRERTRMGETLLAVEWISI